MKGDTKQPATLKDVERCVSALGREVNKLVHLIGDDSMEVSKEAVLALNGVAESICKSLASGMLRPRSRDHVLKLVFLSRLLGPRGSLDVRKALYRLAKREGDPRLASSAAAVLSELFDDEMQEKAEAARRAGHGQPGSSILDVVSLR